MRSLPKKVVALIITGMFVLSLLAYFYFQSRNYLANPEIRISYPIDGSLVYGPEIEIRGKTTKVVTLFINDSNILVSPDGTFSEKLILSSGYNIMKFAGKDRFGKETKKLLEFMVTSTPRTN